MDPRLRLEQNDSILAPFLDASDESDSEQQLASLIFDHAEPVIRNVIRLKLRLLSGGARWSRDAQDAEDLFGEATVRILHRLHDLRANPRYNPINSFTSYVAVVAHHVCYQRLRSRNPERRRLKNKLRYIIRHDPAMELWQSSEGQWLCGFAAWTNRTESSFAAFSLRSLRDGVPTSTFQQVVGSATLSNRSGLRELLCSIFEQMDGPVDFDQLVGTVSSFLRIKEGTAITAPVSADVESVVGATCGSWNSPAVHAEQRLYLKRLFLEIGRLTLAQRKALLLNLRDEGEQGLITLFADLRIASIREIAEVLGMGAEEAAALWRELPLDDLKIAKRLGVTRQQVINLRKAARKQLARRMRGLERKA